MTILADPTGFDEINHFVSGIITETDGERVAVATMKMLCAVKPLEEIEKDAQRCEFLIQQFRQKVKTIAKNRKIISEMFDGSGNRKKSPTSSEILKQICEND